VLATLPDEDAELVLSHFVLTAPYRGEMWGIHERAIGRLGALGGRHAANALSAVLQRRRFWTPFRMAALHRLAIDALGQMGSPDALAIIATVASYGPRSARAAARARMGADSREGPLE
jgi:hypothetical protein